jgi:hypothetical protein
MEINKGKNKNEFKNPKLLFFEIQTNALSFV